MACIRHAYIQSVYIDFADMRFVSNFYRPDFSFIQRPTYAKHTHFFQTIWRGKTLNEIY